MFSEIGPIEAIVLNVVFLAVYFTPSVVAFRRRHPRRRLILAINLVFGATLIGWAVALYLATRSTPDREPAPTR
ncbi:hypothetical protein CTZ27_17725 [Streptomyces griseocarneus]|nr:hypothetical protein CTZ27_17725 [Streptomyces griseocarneus]